MKALRFCAARLVAALPGSSTATGPSSAGARAGIASVARTSGIAAPGGCTLSVGPLQFGRYDSRSDQPCDFTATLVYRCTGFSPTIAILGGGGGQGFERRMMQGAKSVRYNLYLDAARTLIWGDGTGGSGVYPGRAGSEQRVTIYGRVSPHQSVPAGAYVDAVAVAVHY